ncbi:MAG: hypothetical protein H6823_26825, partial [Planctomycetaceae bacterium]|nr:hypothetical protein [Planctomycetaceae bacterium]
MGYLLKRFDWNVFSGYLDAPEPVLARYAADYVGSHRDEIDISTFPRDNNLLAEALATLFASSDWYSSTPSNEW